MLYCQWAYNMSYSLFQFKGLSFSIKRIKFKQSPHFIKRENNKGGKVVLRESRTLRIGFHLRVGMGGASSWLDSSYERNSHSRSLVGGEHGDGLAPPMLLPQMGQCHSLGRVSRLWSALCVVFRQNYSSISRGWCERMACLPIPNTSLEFSWWAFSPGKSASVK